MTEEQKPDLARMRAVVDELKARERLVEFNKLATWRPYPKQQEFLDLGGTKTERLLVAGNQIGKSTTGAYEMAVHLTGLYPPTWKGRRFNHPIRAWAGGESTVAVRDIQQRLLLGEPGVEELSGTGFIPRGMIVDRSLARGASDALDSVQIRHASGGISVLSFKSYEQGREKWQGQSVHVIWFDEEPDLRIYSEGLARLTATKGIAYLTFTPLRGRSDVVLRFFDEDSPDRARVGMGIAEAEHIAPDERARRIATFLPHEREARAYGVPMQGVGRVFQFAEDQISEQISLSQIRPETWKIWGIDPGIYHPFAAALIEHDRETDTIRLLHAFRIRDQLPPFHAFTMMQVAANVPVAWPRDAGNRGQATGEPLIETYKQTGLKMLPEHAQTRDGKINTEAEILDLQVRMSTGRFKAAAHLGDFWDEYRQYHRTENLDLVKVNDDILSALRCAITMRRYAVQGMLGSQVKRRRGEPVRIADGAETEWYD